MSSIKAPSAQKSSSHSISTRSRIARILNRWTIFSVTSIAMIVGSTWYAYEQSKIVDATHAVISSSNDDVGPSAVIGLGEGGQSSPLNLQFFHGSFGTGPVPNLPITCSAPEDCESGCVGKSQIVLDKQSPDLKKYESVLGDYIIEAPDVLMIDVAKIVPKAATRIQSGDGLQINVEGTLKDAPIRGIFVVNPSGEIDFGSSYGKVTLKNKSVEAATEIIKKHLQKIVREPQVSLTVVDTPGLQAINGKYTVGPDGSVNLDKYGSVNVNGKTIAQAQSAIAEHLAKSLENPKVDLHVSAMKSKNYYVITTSYGQNEDPKTREVSYGSMDNVQRFPITGNETVLDAIVQMKGLGELSSKKIWIARPVPGQTENQILTVDWNAITKNGDVATNYKLVPNDRLFIDEAVKPWEQIAQTSFNSEAIDKDQKIEPLFRATDAILGSMSTYLFPWAQNDFFGSEETIEVSENGIELNMPEISAEELAQIKLASYAEASDETDNKEAIADAAVPKKSEAVASDSAFVSDAAPRHFEATRAAQPVRETDIPREMDQSKIIANPFATQTNGAIPNAMPQSPRPLIAEYKVAPYTSAAPVTSTADPIVFAPATPSQDANSSEQKQVTVKFEVMEVSRTKLRSLGVDWSISGKSVKQDGVGAFISLPNEKLIQSRKSGPTNDNLTMGFIEEKKAFDQFLVAMKKNQLVKVLAEPTMSIVAGKTARFHTGSEFPVTKDNGAGTVAIEYKKVGTEIACKPILIKDETLRLEIHPRLSEIDSSRSVTMNGVTIPGLRVREIDTGFEVKVGQTIAICGMPQTKICATMRDDGKMSEVVNEIDTLILVTLESIQPLCPTDMPPVVTAGCQDQAVCAPATPQQVFPNTISFGANPSNAPATAIVTDESCLPKFAQAVPPTRELSLPPDVSPEDAAILNSIRHSLQIDVLKGNPHLSEGALREQKLCEGTLLDASQNPPMPLVDAPHNPDHVASDDDCPGSTPRTTQPRRIVRANDPSAQSDEEIRLSSMNENRPLECPAPCPATPETSQPCTLPLPNHSPTKISEQDSKRNTLIAAAKQLEALAYALDEDSLYDQADVLRATAAEYRAETRKQKVGIGDKISVELNERNEFGERASSTDQPESTLKIIATITEIRPNGDLAFEGVKKTCVNHETHVTTVAGIVSPKEVSNKQTVLGNQVSNLAFCHRIEGPVKVSVEDDYEKPRMARCGVGMNGFNTKKFAIQAKSGSSVAKKNADTDSQVCTEANSEVIEVRSYPDINLRPFVEEMFRKSMPNQAERNSASVPGPKWQPFGPIDGSSVLVDSAVMNGNWFFVDPSVIENKSQENKSEEATCNEPSEGFTFGGVRLAR